MARLTKKAHVDGSSSANENEIHIDENDERVSNEDILKEVIRTQEIVKDKMKDLDSGGFTSKSANGDW